jgi:hypothetical protein
MRQPITKRSFSHTRIVSLSFNLFITMKNAIFSLAALALIASAFTSCKKDPTFKDQLVGQWLSVKVKAGSTDYTASSQYNLNLEANNEFDLDVTATVPFTGQVTQSYSGDWSEDGTKQDVVLTYSDGEEQTWEIAELTETTLTAEIIQSNVRYQVTFEKQ